MTHRLLAALGKPESLIKHVPDREGHDLRYAMNCDKARALGWRRQFSFDTAVEATVQWYVDNEWWWQRDQDRRLPRLLQTAVRRSLGGSR